MNTRTPISALSRKPATAHRRIARIMATVDLEVRDFLAKMWEGEANSAGSGA